MFLEFLIINTNLLDVPTVDQDGMVVIFFSAAKADRNSSSLLPNGIGTGARGFVSRATTAVNVMEGIADLSLRVDGIFDKYHFTLVLHRTCSSSTVVSHYSAVFR